MTRLPGISIFLCAACGGGGSGLGFETVARLPLPQDYALGFEADGSVLFSKIGQLDPVFLLEGTEWTSHVPELRFQLRSFGSDMDGAPLVVHRMEFQTPTTNPTEVWRIEPDGTAARLGAPAPVLGEQAMQNVSGTRFLFGTSTWVLRPGTTTWMPYTMSLRDPVRASDGRLYVRGPQGIVRLESDDSVTLRAPCARTMISCAGAARFGVDRDGRLYLPAGPRLHIFDPDQDLLEEVPLPAGLDVDHVAATGERVLVQATPAFQPAAATQVFALVPDSTELVPVRFGNDDPERSNFQLAIDPAGTIYAAEGDWLGRLVEYAP
jgi:hypothetical protein